ncbi:hypothetical protein K435DRAFT_867558 [Dendrothele bispora CBS 962.96]|uniref:Uncharacterized protein n=1 Tax=Dendrothele bispora (strain CBS 962.96) TaxID=1314807 RepID=A0A4V4HDH4_DENBC|nr:hypothetical protein K435DRAFT_867558 [Dendrothele bispora CBS 962.96]
MPASSSKPPSLSLVGGRLSMPSYLALRQTDKNASTSTAPTALTVAEPVNISSDYDDSDDDIDSFHASDDSDENIDSFHTPDTSNFLGTIDISSDEEDVHSHFANDATTSSTGPIQVPDDEIPNAGVIILSKGKDNNHAPDNDVPTSTTASSSGPSRVPATPRFLGTIDISSDEEDHSPLVNNVAPTFSSNGRFAREVIVISSDEEEHNDHLTVGKRKRNSPDNRNTSHKKQRTE